tara:strand:+ start:1375 stop:1908 length:534 start_codon:yes stop_codon:yes gene_type:complete
MVAPERFNSSQVPRNIDNLCDYVNNLSDENYERYEEWRIENRDNFVREYNDLLNEHHMMQYMDSSDEEDSDDENSELDSDEEDSELDSDEEDSQMDSDNESEDMDSDDENTNVDSDDEYDVVRQSIIEEPQPEDDSDSEIEYSVISDEDSDYDSDEEIDTDYTEWLYPYLSSSHVLL